MMVNSVNNVDLSNQQVYKTDGTKGNNDSDSLDKNAFFELLTTQLKHQDPLKPMDNTQFISQMAQFSSLEQMNNMNENLNQFLKVQGISQGASLIGKKVEYVNSNSGKLVSGKVSKVGFQDNKMYVHLEDGSKISADGISAVY